MPTIDVHWVHCHGDWAIPGYEVRENSKQPNGDIGVLVDNTLPDSKLRRAYKTKIAILHEPRPKAAHIYEMVETLHEEFLAIVTYDEQLLKLPNAHLLPVGGSRIRLGKRFAGPVLKTELLTMIASWKVNPAARDKLIACAWDVDALDGYRWRWQAARNLMARGIPVYGSIGYSAIEIGPDAKDKAHVLAPAKFSVEAECHKANNWFTEKLLDCLMLCTVPIYRGPDNIGEYFDTRGMLLWNNTDEFNEIVDQILAGEIKYEDFWPHILINQRKAMEWAKIPESYCQIISKLLGSRKVHIDIYDPYPNIASLFWDKNGYELHVNPQDGTGDIAVFWDSTVHQRRRDQYKNKFAVLHEPQCKEPRNYRLVTATQDEWAGIFTHDPDMLGTHNTLLGLAAATWAGPQGLESLAPHAHHDKPVLVTMINSNKARPTSPLVGYRMRFAAAQELIRRGIIVYGTGGTVPTPCPGNVAAGKLNILKPAQFSVEVECHKQDNWFTEKLIDCFLLMVVPIYWGPDNIVSYFAPESMLLWNSIEELRAILHRIEAGELKYSSFFPALQYAHATAMQLTYPPQRHLDKIVEIYENQG